MNQQQFQQMYSQFRQNPGAMLSQRFNIPQNMKSPQEIIQHLLNSGQITQNQLNMNVNQALNNPIYRIFMNR